MIAQTSDASAVKPFNKIGARSSPETIFIIIKTVQSTDTVDQMTVLTRDLFVQEFIRFSSFRAEVLLGSYSSRRTGEPEKSEIAVLHIIYRNRRVVKSDSKKASVRFPKSPFPLRVLKKKRKKQKKFQISS